jgi:thiamine monophosphate kinase
VQQRSKLLLRQHRDGLLGDAGKLAYASGLSAVLDLYSLPMPLPDSLALT